MMRAESTVGEKGALKLYGTGQRPEFEEITVVLRGMVRVEHAKPVVQTLKTWLETGQELTTPGSLMYGGTA